LDSVQAQTFGDFEVIVVDDASTDDTRAVLRRHAFPAMRWSTNRRNMGEARTMNRAINEARGRFIKFLHGDDTLRPDCLERMVPIAEEARVSFVFSPRGLVLEPPDDPDLISWSERYGRVHDALGPLSATNEGVRLFTRYLEHGILRNCFAEPSGIMARRSVLEDVGGFHLKMVGHLDGDLLSRLCPGYQVGFVDEPLYNYRRSRSSASSRRQPQNLAFLDAAWSLEGLRRLPNVWREQPMVRTLWRRQLRRVASRLPSELELGPTGWKLKRTASLITSVMAPPPRRSLHGHIKARS
jgi:glycosyltransferase involved in cell wall biosynthesis